MFRTLCAFLLLASPALAIDIYEDTTFTADNAPDQNEWIYVHGSASLTIDGAQNVHSIVLNDASSLHFASGLLTGVVHFKGDNRFVMTGGLADVRNLVHSWPGSSAEIELRSGQFGKGIPGSSAESLDLSDGSHHVAIYEDFLIGGGARVLGSSVSVDLYGENPGYRRYGDVFVAWARISNTVIAEHWLAHSSVPRDPADITGDGAVDLADLNAVRNHFGSLDTALQGDTFPLDGFVDLNDLNRVRNNFGATMNPVPEPSALLLVTLSLTVLAWRGTRRRLAFPQSGCSA